MRSSRVLEYLVRHAIDFQWLVEGRPIDHSTFCKFRTEFKTELRDLFSLVGPVTGCEVLVDDRPVPFARELWLPLIWFLIPR